MACPPTAASTTASQTPCARWARKGRGPTAMPCVLRTECAAHLCPGSLPHAGRPRWWRWRPTGEFPAGDWARSRRAGVEAQQAAASAASSSLANHLRLPHLQGAPSEGDDAVCGSSHLPPRAAVRGGRMGCACVRCGRFKRWHDWRGYHRVQLGPPWPPRRPTAGAATLRRLPPPAPACAMSASGCWCSRGRRQARWQQLRQEQAVACRRRM